MPHLLYVGSLKICRLWHELIVYILRSIQKILIFQLAQSWKIEFLTGFKVISTV